MRRSPLLLRSSGFHHRENLTLRTVLHARCVAAGNVCRGVERTTLRSSVEAVWAARRPAMAVLLHEDHHLEAGENIEVLLGAVPIRAVVNNR